MKLSNLARRERCYLLAKRAARLNDRQAAEAWRFLTEELDRFGNFDVPKFKDIFDSIRAAIIHAKQPQHSTPSPPPGRPNTGNPFRDAMFNNRGITTNQ